MTVTLQEVQRIPVESCHAHTGTPVCAVLRDGTHVYGVLGGMHDGKVLLHSAVKGPGRLSVSAGQAKRSLRAQGMKQRSKAKTQALGYPYYPGVYALDAALITLLFTLPFLFV